MSKTVLHDICIGIDDSDKIGVVGANGTGKSTLLAITAGVIEADEGAVVAGSDIRISYLPQDPAFDESKTIDGIKITVKAEEGAFPSGSTLSVRKVTAAEEKKAEAAVESERDENANVATSYTFDIKVLDKDGNEIQPAEGKKVEVLFKAEEIDSDCCKSQ